MGTSTAADDRIGSGDYQKRLGVPAIVRQDRPDMQLAALETPTACLVLGGGGRQHRYGPRDRESPLRRLSVAALALALGVLLVGPVAAAFCLASALLFLRYPETEVLSAQLGADGVLGQRMRGADRDVVEEAKAPAAVCRGVMSRRSDHSKARCFLCLPGSLNCPTCGEC